MSIKFGHYLVPIILITSLAALPARAGQLVDWVFNSERNVIGIKTNKGVKPKVFLLSSPNRLVVDLPGVDKKGATVRKQYGGAIREIRVSEVNGSTRIVMQLAPGYGVSARNIKVASDSSSKWYVRLLSVESGIPAASGEIREEVAVPNTSNSSTPKGKPSIPTTQSASASSSIYSGAIAGLIPLGREMTPLKSQLTKLMRRYRSISPSMFVVDVDTGNYVGINAERVDPAASTIKLPILVAFFEAVDAGRVRLDEKLTVKRYLITGGSGNLQYYRGAKVTAWEAAKRMISISDNTATNMIMERIGGRPYLNSKFRSWGLRQTYIKNYLGDFRGANKTSAADLVRMSAYIAKRKILSGPSRAKLLDILNSTENRRLLKAGLGQGSAIAHKTGTLGIVLADGGIIEKPSGRLYLAGIIVRRPFNSLKARYFIQQASRIMYRYLLQEEKKVAGQVDDMEENNASLKSPEDNPEIRAISTIIGTEDD